MVRQGADGRRLVGNGAQSVDWGKPMNTKLAMAAARRASGLVLLTLLAVVTLPVSAATCNGSPKARIDPVMGQTVPETTGGVPTVVQLDGNPSTPNNAGNLSFAWEYLGSTPTGLAVTINNPDAELATFSTPAVGALGATLRFKLTVCGIASTAATTNVNVTNVVANNNPVAVALSSPSNPHEGDLVTLDGTGSFDPDPGSTLSYAWVQTGGSPSVTLSSANASGSIVAFIAPNTPIDTGASLTFRLTVSDGSLSGSDEEIVNVVWTNDPPVASLSCPAGGIFVVDEGDPVTLDGSASTDSDGSIQSFTWSQDEGLPTIGIGALTSQAISFNAPQLGYMQLGGFRILLTVTDNLGAQDTADCGVYINDITPPSIAVPADITAEADSSAGASVAYEAFAQDAVDDELPYALPCVLPSGSVFPLAPLPGNALTTQVVCNAIDSAGNAAAPATFNITVHDTTAPAISVPGSLGLQATKPEGADVEFNATTADAVDGPGNATCTPASGSTFALGDTTVSCTATDARGNGPASATFIVNVFDLIPPEITAPAGQTFEATAEFTPLTSADYGMATATDAVGIDTIGSNAPATFPLGDTVITWTATDTSGNSSTAITTITIVDTTAPALTTPGNLTAEATSAAGAIVSFATSATDLVSGAVAVDCTPASGNTFTLGTTIVNCGATDGVGNTATGTFTVSVVDTTKPVISGAANQILEATSPAGAVATFALTASDSVDPSVPVLCSATSGDTFPLGVTTVNCTATDDSANVATASFTIDVQDTIAPLISGAIDQTLAAVSPAGAVATFVLTASDAADPDVPVVCNPTSGSTFALGATLVECTATDDSGNQGTASFTINVHYPWTGFFRPVDNLPMVNGVKAGSAVPVKFSLGGNMGLAIFAAGYPRWVSMQCASGVLEDTVEETVAAGGSSLSYDATANQYVYVWKTDKAWAGSCRQLQLKLADGTTQVANFKFTK